MTYRQLLAAIERAKELDKELFFVNYTFPHKGSADEKDAAQTKINEIEIQLDGKIDLT